MSNKLNYQDLGKAIWTVHWDAWLSLFDSHVVNVNMPAKAALDATTGHWADWGPHIRADSGNYVNKDLN